MYINFVLHRCKASRAYWSLETGVENVIILGPSEN